MEKRSDRGALHLVGIFLVLLLAGGLFIVSSWSHELVVMKAHVEEMQGRIEKLENRISALEGRTAP